MSLCMTYFSFQLDRSNNWFVHIHLFIFCLAYHIQLKWAESQHALGCVHIYICTSYSQIWGLGNLNCMLAVVSLKALLETDQYN